MIRLDVQADNTGAVLITALLLLLFLTMMGKMAITASQVERVITKNHQHYRDVLHSAEAGLEQAKEKLQTEFTVMNQTKIATGRIPDWDFALNGMVAGIPSASLVAIVVILGAIGLPAEGIGLILAVDRILDMCRTSVNVFSDSCGAVLIGRSEGEQEILKT